MRALFSALLAGIAVTLLLVQGSRCPAVRNAAGTGARHRWSRFVGAAQREERAMPALITA
jgi:hypothetical protein